MKIAQNIVVVIAAALLLYTGCSKDNNPVGQSGTGTSVIMPLKIGNQWTYRVSFLDTLGNVRAADTMMFKIVRDTIIQNETWYFIGSDSNSKELLTNRADGL